MVNREPSYHIGASGLIYVLSFIFLKDCLQVLSTALSLSVIMIYGGYDF
jgi:hypothetical protein